MRNIVINLHRAADLSGTMKAMRLWLDDHRCQPHRFICDHSSGWHIIHVDFNEDDNAMRLKSTLAARTKNPHTERCPRSAGGV